MVYDIQFARRTPSPALNPVPEPEKTVLFIDFDNTISCGDVLDSVIERFSRSEQWRHWQAEWCAGRISTLECLQRQVGDLEVDEAALLDFVRAAPIDPDFVRLQDWAARTGARLNIVSDNFAPIVRAILARHGVELPPIYANELRFEGRRLVPSFPYRSAACRRCAHCKAVHFARCEGLRTLYVGDGLSDTCPAQRADRVFAKDSLAEFLRSAGRPFVPFSSLGDVVRCLEQDAAAAAPRPD